MKVFFSSTSKIVCHFKSAVLLILIRCQVFQLSWWSLELILTDNLFLQVFPQKSKFGTRRIKVFAVMFTWRVREQRKRYTGEPKDKPSSRQITVRLDRLSRCSSSDHLTAASKKFLANYESNATVGSVLKVKSMVMLDPRFERIL
jgi:hypothetical protein